MMPAHPVKMRLWPAECHPRGNGRLPGFAFAKGIKDSELFLGCANILVHPRAKWLTIFTG